MTIKLALINLFKLIIIITTNFNSTNRPFNDAIEAACEPACPRMNPYLTLKRYTDICKNNSELYRYIYVYKCCEGYEEVANRCERMYHESL